LFNLDIKQILVFISVFYDFLNFHKEKFLNIPNISFWLLKTYKSKDLNKSSENSLLLNFNCNI